VPHSPVTERFKGKIDYVVLVAGGSGERGCHGSDGYSRAAWALHEYIATVRYAARLSSCLLAATAR